MNKSDHHKGFVALLTFVASLGGLLFGYDTAVISGTTEAIQVFFIDPMYKDASLAAHNISEFKIVATACFGVSALVFIFLFYKLFHHNILKTGLSSFVMLLVIGYILNDQFLSQNGVLNENLAMSIKGFVISSALFGCIIGGGIAGIVSERFGRKSGLLLSAVLFSISALGSAIPEYINFYGGTTMSSFVFYRIVGGIGVGIASMLSPMYIAEIAPAKIRGKLVSWNQFFIIFGMLLVYFVNYFIAKGQPSEWINSVGWRYMFASELLPSTLFLFLLFIVPESPRYMIQKGKDAQAAVVLGKISGDGSTDQIVLEIKNSLVEKTAPWLSFGTLLIVIGVLLSAFQQLVGINVVLYYAPEIFKTLGSGTDASLLQTIVVGLVNLAFTVLAIQTVDSLGRVRLQFIGALIMAASMLILGTCFYYQVQNIIPLLMMLTYVAGFAMSWGPVTWVQLSEIFPNSIKGALALAVAVQWFMNYIVSWTFPMMNESTQLTEMFHHGFAYWIYGIMGILAAIFVVKYVPETKGKSLEEMEQIWKPEGQATTIEKESKESIY